jgi:hypothetical protein
MFNGKPIMFEYLLGKEGKKKLPIDLGFWNRKCGSNFESEYEIQNKRSWLLGNTHRSVWFIKIVSAMENWMTGEHNRLKDVRNRAIP